MDREAATPVTNMPKCFGNACAFHDHDMRSRFDKVDKCNRQKDGHIGHNSLLLGAPESTINKLQRAQKNAARVVLAANRRSDAKPLLRQLHWLLVRQRVIYKTAVLTRKAHTQAFHPI